MARRRWIWIEGKGLVEVSPEAPPPRPRVHFIGDQHRPFRSMADGKMYDSKSRYRAEIKARGYVELGNDQIEPAKPVVGSAEAEIRQTMAEMGIPL